MTDEKFTFIEEVREKRQTGRSSHNRKPHAGRGGKVRLQSDNLTKKELLALNGETKTYRMNEPMAWKEFKKMPDDLKVSYITAIWEKYNAPDREIQRMLGVSNKPYGEVVKRLGIAGSKSGWRSWDKAGFEAWAFGNHAEQAVAPTEEAPAPVAPAEEAHEPAVEIRPVRCVPDGGSLSFTGKPAEVLETVWRLLGNGKFRITIQWELLGEEGAVDG